MNNLMVTQNESLTMSSLEIAIVTGKEKKTVHRDIKAMVEQLYGKDCGGTDLYRKTNGGIKVDLDDRGRSSMIHLDRNHTDCLLTGYSVVLRMKVITRWREIEKDQQFQIPQTLGEALQLAADQAKQLELQAPKVAFVDNCVERSTLMTATQVAQKHKMSAVKLNKFLDELGGVYSKGVKRSRVFVQPFIDKGYGEMKQTELGYSQALFTTSGEQAINEMLITEGVI